jgi:hypothetical protein
MALPVAVLLLVAAAYAQWAIPRFTRRPGNALALRLILLALGVAVGVTLVSIEGAAGYSAATLFLLGFSLVHVPPALVLLLKRWRRESPS